MNLQPSVIIVIFAPMTNKKEDYSFWTKYKRFAGNEVLLYIVMIIGIIAGIIMFS